ncbi:MAG: enoyl-CoA hydratase/isomerase family protein [Chloroflexi bacterium]|nr:enoyl-CoA hydratase/isomerase family protein [Chloroflexota bacterium]
MPEFETILYEKQRKGVLITLNRPEVMNGLNRAMVMDLRRALAEADADPEIRAVIITGAGRAFSAGFDIAGGGRKITWPYGLPEGANIAAQIDWTRERAREHNENLLQIWDMSKPVIAAVNGWCLAAGSWYALACHMTIASDQAVFGQPEVRMGDDTSFFWPLLVGFKHAARYALTGDHIDAQEALRIGLINEVVAQDELLEHCWKIVERIALIGPETTKINLQVITLGFEAMGLRSALRINNDLKALVVLSKREEFLRPLDDARERGGLREFLNVRDGPFQPEPFGPRSKGVTARFEQRRPRTK